MTHTSTIFLVLRRLRTPLLVVLGACELLLAGDLPARLHAVAEGYLAEAGRETLDGADCLRLALDTTAPGGKVLCTVWLGGDGAPLYAEFSQDSRVVLTARLLSFTSE